MVDELLRRLGRHDRPALARLLSLAARGEALDEIARSLPAAARPSRVVAVTGGAGVGKSTLVGRLIPTIRAAGRTVAVLACDPQSPVSGGALLGDRFRMGTAVDDGVFIRSLAAVGGRGAVAEHLDVMVRLLEAFGFDVILLETVGAGQGDVAVAGLADAVVLLLQPESGDDVQWEKAGILELADVVVIHKSDLPGAEQTAAQVRAALDLSPRPAPIVRVSSRLDQGFAELWQTIQGLPLRRRTPDADEALLHAAQALLARRLDATRGSERLVALVDEWRQGRVATTEAAERLLRFLALEPRDTITP
jgi:LAO/AO transport system ATPase